MNRTIRFTLCALALALSGFAAAPAFAQGPPPGGIFNFNPGSVIRLIQTVTVVGAGETVAQAEDNAIAELEEDYRVLSYTVTNSFCTEVVLNPMDPNSETITLCAAEIQARVIRKLTRFTP